MYASRADVTVATDSGGAADVKSERLTGRLVAIQYIPDGTTPYDNTVDFTITNETTGESLLSQTNVAAAFQKAPRQPTHDNAGTASLFAAGGTAVQDHYILANDRVRIVLAQGGATKTGRVLITVA